MASHQEIYKGFWTNWADGQVSGATLTISRQDGAYLIAFLALFVHISGASFWRLFSFGIFYYRARPNPKNNVILQQQAVLRNSASAISSLRGFVWISLRSRDWRRNLAPISWACLNVAGFLAAGILSSKVTSTRSDVLLKPTHCGNWWQFPVDTSKERPSKIIVDYALWEATLGKLQTASGTYASACYSSGSDNPEGCTKFGRRPPSWESSLYSGCTFGDLCIDNMTFSIDSGYIASDLDLGINSRPEDRISLRLGMECAPLKQDEYTQVYHGDEVASLFSDDIDPEDVFGEPTEPFRYEAFLYGPTTSWSRWKSSATFIWNNGTVAYSLDADGRVPIVDLNVMSAEFDSHGQRVPGSTFEPISELAIPGRQVTLAFLSSNAFYSEIVTDPWFRAERPEKIPITINDKFIEYSFYSRDPRTTVLGCTEKQCIPIGSGGYSFAGSSVGELLQLNPRQKAIWHRLKAANGIANLVFVILGVGAGGLFAYQYHTTSWEAPLPDNQWTLEVEHWFTTILVLFQSTTTYYVTGTNSRFNKLVSSPPAESYLVQIMALLSRSASCSMKHIIKLLLVQGRCLGLR